MAEVGSALDNAMLGILREMFAGWELRVEIPRPDIENALLAKDGERKAVNSWYVNELQRQSRRIRHCRTITSAQPPYMVMVLTPEGYRAIGEQPPTRTPAQRKAHPTIRELSDVLEHRTNVIREAVKRLDLLTTAYPKEQATGWEIHAIRNLLAAALKEQA